jgi:ribosomal-protein-alanine N-acetyltransferase
VFYLETPRLILREILPSDDAGMFELDSDKEVHRYLGNKPISGIEQARNVIALIRQQYIENGIGRWAVIEKSSGEFTGWSGLKLMKEMRNNQVNYYDLGYRFIRKYWGKGYATESAIASRNYGFDIMNLDMMNASADINNIASRHVLEKTGMKITGTFVDHDETNFWFELYRADYLKIIAAH